MLDLVISGCNGRMGRVLEELCAAAPDLQVKAGFDILGPSDREFPIFSNPTEFQEEADVVVDFSHPRRPHPSAGFLRPSGHPGGAGHHWLL